ncbi:YesL family protein [Litchfieldia salsa]|uniref:Uncharacterized membrane protein YesL n=1 Tax=Litchfieldia salsa TaxID=930152 RepID=A0A1H0VY44_9BACI|nr:DUF624 domain-containing protein [Litchfieldia salsa]SDP83231.1 Uncharacterized membrane protein YesL [Litchfieldia salsa]
MDKIRERINDFCSMTIKLVYIQLLWLTFTLLGVVIIGIGPATYAMFTVMRQWIRGNKEISIFKTFFHSFRSEFKESFFFGIIYLVGGIILFVDLIYVQSPLLKGFLIIISFLYTVSLLYIYPILVHYEWQSMIQKLKCSILFGLSYLQYTLMLIVALAVVYFVLFMYPGVLTFFGISIGSYMIMFMANQVFKRIEMEAGVNKGVQLNEPLIKGGDQA